MQNPQGSNPGNKEVILSAKPSLISPKPITSESIEQTLLHAGNTLVKNVYFACIKCDGPLVPSSQCTVCKKTSYRRCVSCTNEIPTGNHDSCNYLVLLGSLRSKTHSEVEVN